TSKAAGVFQRLAVGRWGGAAGIQHPRPGLKAINGQTTPPSAFTLSRRKPWSLPNRVPIPAGGGSSSRRSARWATCTPPSPPAAPAGRRGGGAAPATPPGATHRHKVEALGLGFRAVRPDHPGPDAEADLVRRVMDRRHGSEVVIRELMMSALRESYEDTLAAA